MLMNSGGVAMTNCYLIADENTRQAVLFDAPDHTTEPLLDEVVKRGWVLIGLWLTHGRLRPFCRSRRCPESIPKRQNLDA